MERDINQKNITNGEQFIKLILKLNGDELCALSKILGIRLLTNETDPETKHAIPRMAEDIIDDIIVHFGQMERKDRRWLIRYLKKQTKGR